jgi:hypothetical protein
MRRIIDHAERVRRAATLATDKYCTPGNVVDLTNIAMSGVRYTAPMDDDDAWQTIALYLWNYKLGALRGQAIRHARVYLFQRLDSLRIRNRARSIDAAGVRGLAMLADEPDRDLPSEIQEALEATRTQLNAGDRQVLERLYGLCGREAVTEKELAGTLGVKRQDVNYIRRRSLTKLRLYLQPPTSESAA